MINYFKNHPAITFSVIGLFFIIILAFKPANEEKQVMTIDVWEAIPRKDIGIYVFLNGKELEFIPTIVNGDHKDIAEHGITFNKVIEKYYKEGWRIVSTTSPGTYLSQNGYSRYILEK